ncbi:MAG TPA: hypothetical protein VFV84_00540 [Burkholderiales bacterium]|nr:hypothetical protein [Burkholderiales bacterium]
MHDRYSYVSLFGLNSLSDLKQSVFASTVVKEQVATGTSVDTLKGNVELLGEQLNTVEGSKTSGLGFMETFGRKLLPALAQVGLARSWAPFIGDAAFYSVRNQLVCIDDLERRGEGLSAGDILGLIAFLKEQRNCKVALIFNDDSLDKDGKQRYAEYREKVIDVEVEFAPTVEEAVGYVFAADDPRHGRVLAHSQKLKLTNIRILQRIRRLLDELATYINGKHPSIEDAALGSIVLFAWAFYGRTSAGVPLEFIVSEDFSAFVGDFDAPEGKQTSDKETEWKAILKDYGYLYTDKLDRTLADFIEKGYPDTERLSAVIEELDLAGNAGNAREDFKKVWSLYNESFDDNEAEFVAALTDRFSANAKHLSASDLNSAVMVLRELGRGGEADTLIAIFVEAHKTQPEMFDVGSISLFGSVDEALKERFYEQRGLSQPVLQLEEVVKRIAEHNSWNQEDIKLLAKTSSAEYVNLLNGAKSSIAYKYIAVLLRFGQWADDPNYPAIAARTKEALAELAEQCRLNKVRLHRFLPPQRAGDKAQPTKGAT